MALCGELDLEMAVFLSQDNVMNETVMRIYKKQSENKFTKHIFWTV